MRVKVSERLRGWLPDLGDSAEVDRADFERHSRDVAGQHGEDPERAVYRCLTHGNKHLPKPEVAPPLVAQELKSSHRWLFAVWAVAVLLLLCVIAAKAAPPEPVPNDVRLAHILADAPPPQIGGLIVQFQNQGSTIGTYPAFLRINCSTNMACSASGTTITISSSSTASTAFSALTASANSNTGTFSASGNSWDFHSATEFLVPWQTSATLPGTSGQLLFNNAGVIGAEDPIVSGPDATGVAPTKNPVQTGALDNSTACSLGPCVRSFILANAAPAGTEYGLITRNIPSGTQAVSGTVTANAGTGTFTVGGTVTANAGTGPSTAWKVDLSATGANATAIKVDGSAVTQPVSGTVTANAGTGNFNVVGTQASNSAVGNALEVLFGRFDTALPTLTSGNAALAELDSSGRLLVGSIAGALPTGSNTIGAISNTSFAATQSGNWTARIVGNAGGVVDAAGQNAASPANELLVGAQFNTTPTTITSGNISPLQMDSAGNLLVNIKAGGGSGGTSSSFNAAFPATGTAAGASDGTNMKPLLVDASGFLKVNVAAGGGSGGTSSSFGAAFPATGTAAGAKVVSSAPALTAGNMEASELTTAGRLIVDGSQVTQPVSGTVTANIGTTNGLALDASVTGLQVGQASTTSGQKGDLIQGAVTTAAPAYTTAQTDPLSLTTAGALRTDSSATTQPVSGTVTANAGTGSFTVAQATAANLNATVTGTVTANQGTANATPWNENVAQIGGTAVVADPCQAVAKSFAVINLTANTQIITGTASKKTYVCSINIVAGAATNVALVEGTGTVCATGIAGMAGGSTAATGWNFAANGGLTEGNGAASLMVTATAADNVCILVSAANQISGTIGYVQQ